MRSNCDFLPFLNLLSPCVLPAAFLSGLGHYEIAIPVRVGPNGETLDTPHHQRRKRRSTEDRPPDSVKLLFEFFNTAYVKIFFACQPLTC